MCNYRNESTPTLKLALNSFGSIELVVRYVFYVAIYIATIVLLNYKYNRNEAFALLEKNRPDAGWVLPFENNKRKTMESWPDYVNILIQEETI